VHMPPLHSFPTRRSSDLFCRVARATLVLRINNAVMHTIGTALPKLDALNRNLIATPKLRGWHLTVCWIIILQLLKRLLHDLAIGNLTTLRLANPRAHLTIMRTFLEIVSRFSSVYFSNTAADTDLTLKLMPINQRFGIGIFCDILALGAFVIGIKHAACVSIFAQQNDTHAGLIVCAARR